jgi:hypothetical protein
VDFPASVNGGRVVMSSDDFTSGLEGVGFAPKGHYNLTGEGFRLGFPFADDGLNGDNHNIGGGSEKGGCVVD